MDLSERRVLVTGSSRGSVSDARRFAEGVRSSSWSPATPTPWRTSPGARRHGPPADLSDPHTVGGLIDRVEDEAGPVDVLVNNVHRRRAFAETDSADLQRIYQLNLVTPVQLARQVLPGMLGAPRSHRERELLAWPPTRGWSPRPPRRDSASSPRCWLSTFAGLSAPRSWSSARSPPTCSTTSESHTHGRLVQPGRRPAHRRHPS